MNKSYYLKLLILLLIIIIELVTISLLINYKTKTYTEDQCYLFYNEFDNNYLVNINNNIYEFNDIIIINEFTDIKKHNLIDFIKLNKDQLTEYNNISK